MRYRSREDLFIRVVELFSEQPEVREITIFGRNAEGTADKYSDLDIRVHSNDPLVSQGKYYQLFSEISPVLETFLLVSDANNLAQMIMLKDYSPYQKVDFGICSGESMFRPSKSIYKNEKAKGNINSKMVIFPINYDVQYNLNNFLFGVPRITKCFFRKDFDMYRRWQGMTSVTLGLLFEKYNGYQKEGQKKELSASEATLLCSQINPTENKILNGIFPTNGRLDVVESFLAALTLYVSISKEKAGNFRAPLNTGFIEYIEEFAAQECKNYRIL